MDTIDEDNARRMAGGLFQVAETELIKALKKNRNAEPIVLLNDFQNRIIDPALDRAQLRALAPQGFDAVLAYVVEQLKPRRADFSCFLVVVEPMDDAARSSAVLRAEHLLGNVPPCRINFTRKKTLSAPKIVGDLGGLDSASALWDNIDRRAYFEKGRQYIGLSPQEAEDFDTLHESLLSFAKKQIQESGEFFPFGESVSLSGQRSLSMADPETDDTNQLIELVATSQRAERSQLRAAGIASEVTARPSAKSEPISAIAIDVDLSAGQSFRTITRWERDAEGGAVHFHNSMTNSPQPRIWV